MSADEEQPVDAEAEPTAPDADAPAGSGDGADDAADGPDPAEDEAGAAARTTVPDDEGYAALGEEPPTVEDADSGESAEIGEDAIPFARRNTEREAEANRREDDDDEDDEGRREGGFLGRLFR